jgi:6-phosphogluconolactonase
VVERVVEAPLRRDTFSIGRTSMVGRSGGLVFVGTYSQNYGHVDGKGEGIYAFRLDDGGALTPVGATRGIVDAAFLAAAPGRGLLFCVNDSPDGGVSAFSVDAESGRLTFLNRQPSGDSTCFLAVDRTESVVLAVNHDGGNTVAFPILADGRLGPALASFDHVGPGAQPGHQSSAHPHSVVVDATNRFALVPDKGLDRVYVYRLEPAHGWLVPHAPPFLDVHGGTSPRHLAFHPSQRFAFVTNEVGSTVTSFAFDAENGTLRELSTESTVPDGFTGRNATADIRVHPNGKFVYLTNRGHDTVARFAVDERTGRLTPLGHTSTQGGWSRAISFDPSGRWLLVANQNADTIVAFAADPATGALDPTGAVTPTPTPVCILFWPT